MTVLDFDAIEREAEVLDASEVEELAPARKSSSTASKLAEWFDGQDADSRFVPVTALGQRSTRDEGSVDHDLGSLQTLAGNVRKHARKESMLVEAQAKRRQGVLGILFTREDPSYQEGRGRKPGSTAKPADEAE